MITEDYVSFETAKLLKKKGFDGECFIAFYKDGRIVGRYDSEFSYNYYDRPTLQMAMKWLREVHNLFIGIEYVNIAGLGFVYQSTIGKFNEDYMYCLHKKSYEEVCEEAIKYCLKNLI